MAAVSVKLTAFIRNMISLVLPAGYSPGSSIASYRTVTIDDYGLEQTFDSDNSPEPTAVVADELTIGAGDTTIDLTSDAPVVGAVDGNGDPAASEDLTDYRMFFIQVETPSANTGNVTVKPAAANGYDLWGASNTQGVEFPPGTNLAFVNAGSDLPAVAAAAKDIVFSGTQDDVVRYSFAFEDV